MQMSDQELAAFLQLHNLKPCGPNNTLKDRACRLKDALTKPEFMEEGLGKKQWMELLQGLLEVGDIFCVSKEDLRQAARAQAMDIDTCLHPPIKQRAYKLA